MGTVTMRARRAAFAVTKPSIELNDMDATRSPSAQPRLLKTLAIRFALRCSDAKSIALSARITAGLFGTDSAWLARKSNSGIASILGPPFRLRLRRRPESTRGHKCNQNLVEQTAPVAQSALTGRS